MKDVVRPERLQAAHRKLSETVKSCCGKDVLINLLQVSGKFSDASESLTEAWADHTQRVLNEEITNNRAAARLLTLQEVIATHLRASVAEASTRAFGIGFDDAFSQVFARVSEEGRITEEMEQPDLLTEATNSQHPQTETQNTHSRRRGIPFCDEKDMAEEWDRYCDRLDEKNTD